MKRSTINFSIALVLFIAAMATAFKHRVVKEQEIKSGDTIPQKQYTVTFQTDFFIKKLDTVSYMLGQYIGKSLSVDNAQEILNYYSQLRLRLLMAAKIDSIEIKKPSK